MFDSWLADLPPALSEVHSKMIDEMFETFVPVCVRFVQKSCKEVCKSVIVVLYSSVASIVHVYI